MAWRKIRLRSKSLEKEHTVHVEKVRSFNVVKTEWGIVCEVGGSSWRT